MPLFLCTAHLSSFSHSSHSSHHKLKFHKFTVFSPVPFELLFLQPGKPTPLPFLARLTARFVSRLFSAVTPRLSLPCMPDLKVVPCIVLPQFPSFPFYAQAQHPKINFFITAHLFSTSYIKYINPFMCYICSVRQVLLVLVMLVHRCQLRSLKLDRRLRQAHQNFPWERNRRITLAEPGAQSWITSVTRIFVK